MDTQKITISYEGGEIIMGKTFQCESRPELKKFLLDKGWHSTQSPYTDFRCDVHTPNVKCNVFMSLENIEQVIKTKIISRQSIKNVHTLTLISVDNQLNVYLDETPYEMDSTREDHPIQKIVKSILLQCKQHSVKRMRGSVTGFKSYRLVETETQFGSQWVFMEYNQFDLPHMEFLYQECININALESVMETMGVKHVSPKTKFDPSWKEYTIQWWIDFEKKENKMSGINGKTPNASIYNQLQEYAKELNPLMDTNSIQRAKIRFFVHHHQPEGDTIYLSYPQE